MAAFLAIWIHRMHTQTECVGEFGIMPIIQERNLICLAFFINITVQAVVQVCLFWGEISENNSQKMKWNLIYLFILLTSQGIIHSVHPV